MVGWVGFQEGWRSYETPYLRFDLPAGMNCGVVGPPPELTHMALCRGEFAPGSPACIIAGSRDRGDWTLNKLARRLGGEGVPVDVTGARGARRVDFELYVEEGLALDYVERLTLVVAARRRDFVSLTVRTIAEHDHRDTVERIVRSLAVVENPS